MSRWIWRWYPQVNNNIDSILVYSGGYYVISNASKVNNFILFHRFVVSLLYYGLSLNVGNLGGDIYVNYAISSGVEVVAYTVSVPLIWYMGRKKFYCVCMLTGGVSLLASAATDMYGNKCRCSFDTNFMKNDPFFFHFVTWRFKRYW